MIDIIRLASSSFSYARVLFSSRILNNKKRKVQRYYFKVYFEHPDQVPDPIPTNTNQSHLPTMHLSPDFVAAIIFGVIMMIIGLAPIWIVYWQTGVLLRQQQRESFFPCPDPITVP